MQEKKLASKLAYEEEMGSLKTAKPVPVKITRAEIANNVQKTANKGILKKF